MTDNDTPPANLGNRDLPLTEHQIAILQALADGDTLREIADAHFIRRDSISQLVRRASLKLRAHNTRHAVAIALRKKLIT